MGMFSWLVSKLRQSRFAVTTNSRQLIFGGIYKFNYMQYNKDPAPLVFVLYSGPQRLKSGVTNHYTHGINLNYLSSTEKANLGKMIYMIKKGNQNVDGMTLYHYLKQNMRIVNKKAYRQYFTKQITNPRLASAGLTHYNKLVYPINDPFIKQLNKLLEPASVNETGVPVAYNQNELRNRVTQARNFVPINNNQTISNPQGGPGYRKPAAFLEKPAYLN